MYVMQYLLVYMSVHAYHQYKLCRHSNCNHVEVLSIRAWIEHPAGGDQTRDTYDLHPQSRVNHIISYYHIISEHIVSYLIISYRSTTFQVEWGISEYFSENWLLFLTGSRCRQAATFRRKPNLSSSCNTDFIALATVIPLRYH